MRFRDVQHQDRALALLRRALASGRMPHAYLFEGPEGVGKELAARALVARLLCEDEHLAPAADACGQCRSCRQVASDNHPDFHLIHRGLHKLHPDRAVRARKGLFLAVDLIRYFLIEHASLKPSQGRRRVFLIRDAERMNEEAQNALLKTLEEPPGTACLILVTSSSARLLPTIRSRCQCVPFGLLPTDFVLHELESRAKLSPADSRALATLSDGRLGVALRWQQLGLLELLPAVAEALDGLSAGDPEAFSKGLIELATGLATRSLRGASENEAAEDDDDAEAPKSGGKAIPTDVLREALKLVFLLVAALHRDALLVVSAAEKLRNLPALRASVDQLAARSTPQHLDRSLGAVREAEHMLDRNVAPQLVGEWLAVALRGELAVL